MKGARYSWYTKIHAHVQRSILGCKTLPPHVETRCSLDGLLEVWGIFRGRRCCRKSGAFNPIQLLECRCRNLRFRQQRGQREGWGQLQSFLREGPTQAGIDISIKVLWQLRMGGWKYGPWGRFYRRWWSGQMAAGRPWAPCRSTELLRGYRILWIKTC